MTFLAVSFLWIFFRANSISDAFYFVSHIFNPADWAIQPDTIWLKESIFLGQSKVDVIITLLAIGCMMMVHGFQSRDRIRRMFTEKPMLLRWLLYILLVLAVLNLGVVKEVPFIYAEF
jgi:hypothetical protein